MIEKWQAVESTDNPEKLYTEAGRLKIDLD